jgi:hypothetical protein
MRVTSILDTIRHSLTPLVTAVGFRPSDAASWKDLGWLEYRRQDTSGITLLGVVWIPTEGRVTAELWHPDRLAEGANTGTPEQAIEWQHVWQWSPEEDADQRGREVASAIVARLTMSQHDS